MLQADIAALKHQQQYLENEIVEASCRAASDDSMIAELKCRVIFIREEIDRLRDGKVFQTISFSWETR
jgi:hypothetical protein